jgi:hypothetical protein
MNYILFVCYVTIHHCTNIQILRMTKTRRGSKKCIKRKQTRRQQRRYKKGGAPKVSESEKKKDEAKTMVQQSPHHSLVPAADLRLSFTPAARDLLLVQGARAAHMMQHLGISEKSKTHHHDPLSAMLAPLESARASVMIEAIHASVDRLRASGDFASAVVQLDRALALGSIRARVELADILYDGRVGPISSADEDTDRARALLNVDDPVVRTNPDCVGLRVFFELENSSDLDRQFNDLFDDANKSAATHSKYGMFAFAKCCSDWQRTRGRLDFVPASWYFERCSNEANYDRAQDALGSMGMAASAHIQVASPEEAQDERDHASWYFAFAANQGLRIAMFHLGDLCRVEATRLHAMMDAGLHTMVDAADFQRLISDATYWYQLSKYPCDGQLQELEHMEVALLGLGITRMRL